MKNEAKGNKIIHQAIQSNSGDFNEPVRNLYAVMPRLDQNKLDVIIANKFPDEGLVKPLITNWKEQQIKE